MLREIEDNDFEISEQEITDGIEHLFNYITTFYGNGATICGILTGAQSLVTMIEEKLKGRPTPFLTCFIGARSYKNDQQQDKVAIYGDRPSIHFFRKKKVILIDDVIDSGKTMQAVGRYLHDGFAPASIEPMALVVKGDKPDWISKSAVAFRVPKSKFIIGYGMDYNGHYRDLKVIRPITVAEKAAASTPNTDDDPTTKVPDKMRAMAPQKRGQAVAADAIGVKKHQHVDTGG